MRITKSFFGAVKQGVRTGVYVGPVGQTALIVMAVVALFVAGGVKSGFVTVDELRGDPFGTTWKMVEPTVEDLRGKWDNHFGGGTPADDPATDAPAAP
jgi:hypothetical protein